MQLDLSDIQEPKPTIKQINFLMEHAKLTYEDIMVLTRREASKKIGLIMKSWDRQTTAELEYRAKKFFGHPSQYWRD